MLVIFHKRTFYTMHYCRLNKKMIDIDQNNQFVSGLYQILTEIPLGLILRTLTYRKEF